MGAHEELEDVVRNSSKSPASRAKALRQLQPTSVVSSAPSAGVPASSREIVVYALGEFGDLRIEAIRAVARWSDWALFPTLLRFGTRHPVYGKLWRVDARTREAVAAALATFRGADAEAALLQLVEAEEASVRAAAIASLRPMASATAANALCAIVRDIGRAEDMRLDAVFALGDFGPFDVEQTLLETLRSEDSRFQLAAILSLRPTGTWESAVRVAEIARSRKHAENVREQAEITLKEIQSRLANATVGQLAVAELQPEVGRVSIAESGRVSVVAPAADPADREERGLRSLLGLVFGSLRGRRGGGSGGSDP